MGTLSDPGPRYREATGAAARHDDYDSGDDASLATENSDEEPLDGSPEEHVEAMLSKCLEPDERQGHVMTDSPTKDSKSSAQRPSSAMWNDCSGAQTGTEDDDDDDCSEQMCDTPNRENLIKQAEMQHHIEVLEMGVKQFADVTEAALMEAQMAADDVETRRPPEGSLTTALGRRCEELRDSQRQLRVLALQQQALFSHFTQQLLKLAQMHARACHERDQEAAATQKQLSIVRRETARLCDCLEKVSVQASRAGSAPPSLSGSIDGSQTTSPAPTSTGLPAVPSQQTASNGVTHAPASVRPVSARPMSGRPAQPHDAAQHGKNACEANSADALIGMSMELKTQAPSQIIDLVALACTRAASSLSSDDVCATGGCVCHASPCGRAAPESRDAMSGERPVSARPHDEARRADGTASPRRVPPRFVRPAHAEQATVNSTYAPRRPPQRRLLGPPNARKPALSLGGHSGGGHGVGVTGGGAGLVTNGLDAHETAAELLRQPAVSSAVAIALWQLLAEQGAPQPQAAAHGAEHIVQAQQQPR